MGCVASDAVPSPDVPFATICDIVEGAIIKRRAAGRDHGVALLAEGLLEKLDPETLDVVYTTARDEVEQRVVRDVQRLLDAYGNAAPERHLLLARLQAVLCRGHRSD